MFFSVFKPAFLQVFSKENIWSTWSKTGLWLYNPNIVLNTMKVELNSDKDIKNKEAPTQGPNKELKTLKILKLIHCFQKHFTNNPTKELQQKLFKANITLTIKQEIAVHRVAAFKRALTLKKTKRKRFKRLNLLGKEAIGVPQFFSSKEIKKAYAF